MYIVESRVSQLYSDSILYSLLSIYIYIYSLLAILSYCFPVESLIGHYVTMDNNNTCYYYYYYY